MNMTDSKLTGVAGELYEAARNLPIVSPHGHCEASWFSQNSAFPNPAALLVQPDHYVFRMLYSLGIALSDLGIGEGSEEKDPREVFRLFASNWHLFLGTPSRTWLEYSLREVFSIDEQLSAPTADAIYDHLATCLAQEYFRPRALFDRFNIELLATTDGALAPLDDHKSVSDSEWAGRIIPTFRPDSVINPTHQHFCNDVKALGELTNTDVGSYSSYLEALRKRRAFFISCGATATDHDVPDLHTEFLNSTDCEALFGGALAGTLSAQDALRFHGHMLIEMAQMSVEDGLVMQIHAGATRSTNRQVFEKFGSDKGADIPKPTNWVAGLDALLNRVGNASEFTLIAFTLDESAYARELAPMAGHWPALKLGPPWWFHDSENGIARYFDRVVETAGYWNLAGFNDDTRAFTSIPARHDLWRRCVAIHLAEQISRGRMGIEDARRVNTWLARDAAIAAYKLEV